MVVAGPLLGLVLMRGHPAPRASFSKERMREVVAAMSTSAKELSSQLGYLETDSS